MGYDRVIDHLPPDPWKLLPHTFASVLSDGAWIAYRYLILISHVISLAIARGGGRILVSLPPRHGKAMALDTPIPTPDGWKMIGDLRVGDKIFDDQGKICSVTGKTPIWKDRDVAIVVSDTGGCMVSDYQHEWRVRLCRKHKNISTHTTEYLLNRKSNRKPMVERHSGLDLPRKDLPIDPYVLGVWLGDGNSGDGVITQGSEDFEFIKSQIEIAGYKILGRQDPRVMCIRGLKVALRESGLLYAKHIPAEYLRASKSQRKSLLQGLIDTDGYVANDGQIEFCTIHSVLADNVKELIVSLGCKASIIKGNATLNGKTICTKYRVMFYMAEAARLPRKAIKCKDGTRQPNHYLDFRESKKKADTVCIEVDSPSHMFLCGTEMIPTHNSWFISQWVPAWFLANWPHKRVILTTYESTFAATWGRKVRNIIKEHGSRIGVSLADDSTAANNWSTDKEGGMMTAGVGGPITGKGMDLGIIDDPHKNWQEAQSQSTRKGIQEWFDSTFYTRAEPGATIIVLATRWNEDDLIGYLTTERAADGWFHIVMPAIAEENDILGRLEGEALCPERYDIDALVRIKANMTAMMWAALFQQRPAPAEGTIFLRERWKFYDRKPVFSFVLQSWDTATKKNYDAAFSVCQTWGISPFGVYLIDQFRERVQYPQLRKAVDMQYYKYRPNVILIEDRDSGQALIQSLQQETSYPVIPVYPDMDKLIRAQAVSPWQVSERLWLPTPSQASWIGDFVESCAAFPNTKFMDEVDAMSQAIAYVMTMAIGGRVHGDRKRVTSKLLEGFREMM